MNWLNLALAKIPHWNHRCSKLSQLRVWLCVWRGRGGGWGCVCVWETVCMKSLSGGFSEILPRWERVTLTTCHWLQTPSTRSHPKSTHPPPIPCITPLQWLITRKGLALLYRPGGMNDSLSPSPFRTGAGLQQLKAPQQGSAVHWVLANDYLSLGIMSQQRELIGISVPVHTVFRPDLLCSSGKHQNPNVTY